MASTNQLARRLGIQGQSIRARVCRTGSYFGLRPDKLPNGQLDWPPVEDAISFLKKQTDGSPPDETSQACA